MVFPARAVGRQKPPTEGARRSEGLIVHYLPFLITVAIGALLVAVVAVIAV